MCVNILLNQKYRFTPPHPINPNWKQIENFKNKNRFLEKTTFADLPLSAESCDYVQVTEKLSRKFSCSERVLRILLGLILVILTLGIILIFKPIRKLFYKDHVSIKLIKPIWFSKTTLLDQKVPFKESPIFLFTFQEFDQINLQQTISDNIDDIKKKNLKSKNVQIFVSRDHIFSLSDFPGWIFKTCFTKSEKTLQRFQRTQNIAQFCKQNNFDHLVIPESHLIKVNVDGKPVPIIVERMLNIESNPSLQENLYIQHYNEYTRALEQLVHLICQKNLQDIKWENCPLLFDNSTKTFSKIGLIDLETLNLSGAEEDEGLFGNILWNRRGIIQCVPPQHFPTIKSIISTYNKSLTEYQDCVQKRLTELQRNQQLSRFYQEKGIIHGNEPITSDPNSLLEDIDLDLDETFKDLTMKSAALETIQYINQKLAEISINPPSIQKARIIYLDRNTPDLSHLHFGIFSPTTYKGKPCNEGKESWLAYIIRALIKKRVIFDVISYSSANFQVQV